MLSLSSCEKFITQDPEYLLTPEVAVRTRLLQKVC